MDLGHDSTSRRVRTGTFAGYSVTDRYTVNAHRVRVTPYMQEPGPPYGHLGGEEMTIRRSRFGVSRPTGDGKGQGSGWIR
ncbi:hypothetical protein Acsp02_39870 [Actinoplanes sp. NBRC 103695]|nr:hypothetical protein Acsp02_39870 [Actinoplanes sp. NBRC 103695]